MNPDMLLGHMRDIRELDAVGWWPLAPGWWLLLAAFAIAAIALHFGFAPLRNWRRRLAHVIAPLTQDTATLRQQLPALSPDLLRLKGSRVSEALLGAARMLAASPKEGSRHVLLVTDGDFAEDTGLAAAAQLAGAGISLHVLGIGTSGGGRVRSPKGNLVRDSEGNTIASRLDEAEMKRLAATGHGIYRTADFREADTRDILATIEQGAAAAEMKGQSARVWHERFTGRCWRCCRCSALPGALAEKGVAHEEMPVRSARPDARGRFGRTGRRAVRKWGTTGGAALCRRPLRCRRRGFRGWLPTRRCAVSRQTLRRGGRSLCRRFACGGRRRRQFQSRQYAPAARQVQASDRGWIGGRSGRQHSGGLPGLNPELE